MLAYLLKLSPVISSVAEGSTNLPKARGLLLVVNMTGMEQGEPAAYLPVLCYFSGLVQQGPSFGMPCNMTQK